MCPSRAVAGDRADAAVAAPADPRRSTAALRVGTVATAVAAAAAAAAASRATVVTYWSGGGTIDRHKRGEDPSVPRRRHHRGRAGQPSLARQRTRGRCRRVGQLVRWPNRRRLGLVGSWHVQRETAGRAGCVAAVIATANATAASFSIAAATAGSVAAALAEVLRASCCCFWRRMIGRGRHVGRRGAWRYAARGAPATAAVSARPRRRLRSRPNESLGRTARARPWAAWRASCGRRCA